MVRLTPKEWLALRGLSETPGLTYLLTGTVAVRLGSGEVELRGIPEKLAWIAQELARASVEAWQEFRVTATAESDRRSRLTMAAAQAIVVSMDAEARRLTRLANSVRWAN